MDELKLSFFRFLPHALIANTISTYGPLKSGEIGVIQIYDAQFSCPPQASMAVIIVGRAMDISIVIILSLFTIFLVNNEKLSSIILILIFIIIFVLMLFLFLLNRSFGMIIMDNIGKIRVLSKLSDRLIVFASEYYDNLTLILKNKGVKWYLLIFTFSRWIIEFFMNYYLYLIMSIDIKIFELFAIIGLSYAIGVSSGTPGAVGISQFTSLAIMIYALGIPAELAIITVSIGLSLGIIVNLLLISIGISLSFIIKVNL